MTQNRVLPNKRWILTSQNKTILYLKEGLLLLHGLCMKNLEWTRKLHFAVYYSKCYKKKASPTILLLQLLLKLKLPKMCYNVKCNTIWV